MFGLALCVAVGAGCGEGHGSASLTLTPSEGRKETLSFGTRGPDGIEGEPLYTSSSIQMAYASTQRSEVLGGAPKMLVSSYNRVLDPTVTPVFGGEDRFGVGLMEGQVLLQVASGAVTAAATTLYIDQWKFSGAAGVAVKGRFVGSVNGLGSEGSFNFVTDCEDELAPGGALCGDTAPAAGFTSTLGVKRGYLYCPDVFLTPFIGAGEGAVVAYVAHRRIEVEGAEVTFSCADTRGAARAVLCGAEKANIDWQGCSWDVYALAMPSEIAGERRIRFWMGAIAGPGCQFPVTYCNTEWLDDGAPAG